MFRDFKKFGITELVGEGHIFPGFEDALAYANVIPGVGDKTHETVRLSTRRP